MEFNRVTRVLFGIFIHFLQFVVLLFIQGFNLFWGVYHDRGIFPILASVYYKHLVFYYIFSENRNKGRSIGMVFKLKEDIRGIMFLILQNLSSLIVNRVFKRFSMVG